MKTSSIIITMIVAIVAGSPLFPVAQAASDQIVASFERDLNREPTRIPVRPAAICDDVDPLQTLVNARLQGAKDDTRIMTARLSEESIGCDTLTQ